MRNIFVASTTLISVLGAAGRISSAIDKVKPTLPKEIIEMTSIEAVSNVFWGILAIGLGSIFLFFGVRVFKLAVGIAGFAAFGLGAYILSGQVYGTMGLNPPSKDLVRIVVSLAAGVLGGFISVWLWKVALVSLGVLGGLGFSLYLLSWKSNGLLSKPTHRTIFISVFSILGAISSLFLETAIIIIASSIVGSISVFSGIDVFAKTGFNEAFYTLLKNKGSYMLTKESYGMLAACGGTAAIGGLAQYMMSKKKANSKTFA